MSNNDIHYLKSRKETLLKWIKIMPTSQKICIKNILCLNSGDGTLDKQVIQQLQNVKNYYIIQSDYNNYQSCIQNLFGNFKFKISYSDLVDYEFSSCILYDVIVFFDGMNNINEASSFIKLCSKFINKNGKLWIFTHENKGCLNSIKKSLGINDKLLRNSLNDINCHIFNSYIPTFINVNKLDINSLSKILRKECDDNDLRKFQLNAIENYGEFISIPISIIILSNFIQETKYSI